MVTQSIRIDSLDKVQRFVQIMNGFSGKFDVVSGCSVVNAKSVMGIFSLDISRPISLYIYNEESAAPVLSAISPFTPAHRQ
ncbi:MAG: HPr family phosphocarrier protein [Eubacterium sp.]|nr:HPr family phosphocarrier protein [Eubacterium sp.]